MEEVPIGQLVALEEALRKSSGLCGREGLPFAPDAWYVPGSVRVEYGISFTRYFYRPQPLRPPEEIWADIRALEQEAEGLLEEIRGGAA